MMRIPSKRSWLDLDLAGALDDVDAVPVPARKLHRADTSTNL